MGQSPTESGIKARPSAQKVKATTGSHPDALWVRITCRDRISAMTSVTAEEVFAEGKPHCLDALEATLDVSRLESVTAFALVGSSQARHTTTIRIKAWYDGREVARIEL